MWVRSWAVFARVCACLCVWPMGRVRAAADEADDAVLRSRYALHRTRMNCAKAQSNIDFKELMGLWNVIEVIEHSERYMERRNYLRAVTQHDACPVVHFSTDDDREVRMLWNDQSGYIQYTFRMTNINNPGFWMSLGYQSGTMVDSSYEHFSGTAQVMKAVQSHMVLTFCSPNERHFTVILARNKYLTHDEIRGVHKQLGRVNLPLVQVQAYCSTAAGLAAAIAPWTVLLAVIAALYSSSDRRHQLV